jgi:hypothetical protein
MIEGMETVSAAPSAAASASVEWPDLAPPVALAEGPLGVVQAADREIARLTAVRAKAVAAFAALRPASADRARGEPGAMSAERWAARPEILRPVSEWATQELQLALSLTEGAAQKLLDVSLTLVSRLPGVHAALQGGGCTSGSCGRCWTWSRRSPMTGCARRWRRSCWAGWPGGPRPGC